MPKNSRSATTPVQVINTGTVPTSYQVRLMIESYDLAGRLVDSNRTAPAAWSVFLAPGEASEIHTLTTRQVVVENGGVVKAALHLDIVDPRPEVDALVLPAVTFIEPQPSLSAHLVDWTATIEGTANSRLVRAKGNIVNTGNTQAAYQVVLRMAVRAGSILTEASGAVGPVFVAPQQSVPIFQVITAPMAVPDGAAISTFIILDMLKPTPLDNIETLVGPTFVEPIKANPELTGHLVDGFFDYNSDRIGTYVTPHWLGRIHNPTPWGLSYQIRVTDILLDATGAVVDYLTNGYRWGYWTVEPGQTSPPFNIEGRSLVVEDGGTLQNSAILDIVDRASQSVVKAAVAVASGSYTTPPTAAAMKVAANPRKGFGGLPSWRA